MIFIGGYMHSGTTMLLKILAKHSWIYALPNETRFFEYLEQYEKLPTQENKVKRIYSSIYDGSQQIASKYKPKESGDFTIPKIQSSDPVSIFIEITQKLAGDDGKKVVVEKTPTNIFFIPQINKNFEKAKIVLIHRDVRQVLASKKERLTKKSFERYSKNSKAYKRFEKDYDPYLDAISWKRSVKKIIENESNSNVYILSYTDLVTAPKSVLEELCKWLEIPFEKDLLLIEDANSSDVNKTKVKGVSTMSLESYKAVLSLEEINFITSFCKKEMDYLGYHACEAKEVKILGLVYFIIKGSFSFLRRVYKRYRLMTFANFIIAAKNYLKRI